MKDKERVVQVQCDGGPSERHRHSPIDSNTRERLSVSVAVECVFLSE